jgi:hypothetical protein
MWNQTTFDVEYNLCLAKKDLENFHNGISILLMFNILKCTLAIISKKLCTSQGRLVSYSNQWVAQDKYKSSQHTFVYRCVEEYINDTKVDHVPDILNGLSMYDNIYHN